MKKVILSVLVVLIVLSVGVLGYSYYRLDKSNDSLLADNTGLSQDLVSSKYQATRFEEIANESQSALSMKYAGLALTIPARGNYLYPVHLAGNEYIDFIIISDEKGILSANFNNVRTSLNKSISLHSGFPYVGGFGTGVGDDLFILIENSSSIEQATVHIMYRIYSDHSRSGFWEMTNN
ncbi:hypothetical protein [Dehalogenimonas etheniformans]|uniref:Uncharacterized protein n=1 Tax=Dehalogenimonas etheniformans TaxID=1536648 RepID=A0A2P5P9Z6_9CHLR|nr:hypothetical protein [Dehalogenimonas etheniformans]PPD59136.1 hypothetical protein JP09_000200 [Dehalogenimonas etheniformans]QNT75820.1 hypothetical protein HX448_03510 [Dehalogenimonas etheniformans]